MQTARPRSKPSTSNNRYATHQYSDYSHVGCQQCSFVLEISPAGIIGDVLTSQDAASVSIHAANFSGFCRSIQYDLVFRPDCNNERRLVLNAFGAENIWAGSMAANKCPYLGSDTYLSSFVRRFAVFDDEKVQTVFLGFL